MIPTREHTASASSMECVVNMAPRSSRKLAMIVFLARKGTYLSALRSKHNLSRFIGSYFQPTVGGFVCLFKLLLIITPYQTNLLEAGSMPVDGSSISTIFGLPSMLIAKHSWNANMINKVKNVAETPPKTVRQTETIKQPQQQKNPKWRRSGSQRQNKMNLSTQSTKV